MPARRATDSASSTRISAAGNATLASATGIASGHIAALPQGLGAAQHGVAVDAAEGRDLEDRPQIGRHEQEQRAQREAEGRRSRAAAAAPQQHRIAARAARRRAGRQGARSSASGRRSGSRPAGPAPCSRRSPAQPAAAAARRRCAATRTPAARRLSAAAHPCALHRISSPRHSRRRRASSSCYTTSPAHKANDLLECRTGFCSSSTFQFLRYLRSNSSMSSLAISTSGIMIDWIQAS